MPIRPFLAAAAFDPEVIKIMSEVLERVCAEIGVKLGDGKKKNPAAEIVAEKIIELAQRGVRTPTALYEATIADFRPDGPKAA
jgi:hypothetical protein